MEKLELVQFKYGKFEREDYYRAVEADAVINRLTAAASNLLAKHKLGAVSEADIAWMEKELKEVKQ